MTTHTRQETTKILAAVARGDPEAAERLMPVIYGELRDLAQRAFRRQGPGHTLQPTALVHEAFLRLVDSGVSYRSRAHFMATAALVMKQILIDHARKSDAQKRGGQRRRVAMQEQFAVTRSGEVDLLALGEALERLAELDARRAKVVDLRFFGGLSLEETAEVLGLARSTVTEDWRFARAWLACQLEG